MRAPRVWTSSRRERLVHQQHLGPHGERPGDRPPSGACRPRARPGPLLHRRGEADAFAAPPFATRRRSSLSAPRNRQAEAHVSPRRSAKETARSPGRSGCDRATGSRPLSRNDQIWPLVASSRAGDQVEQGALLPQPEGPRKTTNSPGVMSRSMSRRASWARAWWPSAQNLADAGGRPRRPFRRIGKRSVRGARSFFRLVGQPIEDALLLRLAQQPVEGEASTPITAMGEEHQRRIEGVARPA